MFKKTIYNYVCLFGVLTLIATACQEDRELETATTVPVAVEQPDIIIENGLLHFKDQSIWEATVKEMQEAEDYGEYVANIGFISSLRTKYDAIEEGDEELEDYFEAGTLPKIQDDLFANLLNEQAMVKIGNVIYKVTADYTFSAIDEDGSMRQKFQEYSALNKVSGVIAFENVDYLADKTLVVEDEEGKEIARFQGSSERDWPKPGSSQVKAEIGAWSRTYGIYSSIGVKIETQSYRRGGILRKKKWRSRSSDYLYCYGETLTKECSPGCTDGIFAYGSNSRRGNRCERTLRQASGGVFIVAYHVTNYVEGTYKVRFDAGEPIYQTTFRFE